MDAKTIKKEFKAKAAKEPDKYYATSVLKAEGFMRKLCNCGNNFWTVVKNQKVCGDPSCSGGFRFIGNAANPKLDYVGVWKAFAELFTKKGYTPIKRYPVVARWRKDTDFVQASIYDFQPYVVSGEVDPPANPLVVPQFCLRFNDIDNVGLTGSHFSGFDMIGQHAFTPQETWDQAKYFRDIYDWLIKGLHLPKEEITFHEDAWAGGGNFGPSMEYFSRGLELGNQVYMLFEQTEQGPKPLKLRVLDMGMGHERNAWFALGTPTAYDATFPKVLAHIKKQTGLVFDAKFQQKFLPFASYLNVDEVENLSQTWKKVAKEVGMPVDKLKQTVLPMQAAYSVAEHSRSLLIALADGALPSNVGGGYNLRVLYRRAQAFIDQYQWDLDMGVLAQMHATELKGLYPELEAKVNQVQQILSVEKRKYAQSKEKTKAIVSKMLTKDITTNDLLELYDSQGIAPQLIVQEAKIHDKKVTIPEDFFAQVAARHEKKEQEHQTVKETKLDLHGLAETKILYYGDWSISKSEGKILKILGNNVILDQTVCYPTSGGQLNDIGTLNGKEIIDIFKQGPYIVHVLKDVTGLKEGEKAVCIVDKERRTQLAIHHSSTHIIQASARSVLGEHINQAGAKKTLEQAHIDITHYDALSDEDAKKIEQKANEIIKKDIVMIKSLMPRTEAEQTYGMAIYQGGAVPGKVLRIVEIKDVDVQACGGTHLNSTGEAQVIKIIKTSKIQDGIVRIYFTAGKAAQKTAQSSSGVIEEAAKLLSVKINQVPSRAQELFTKWKNVSKAVKKGVPINPEDKKLISTIESKGDALAETAKILSTQPEYVPKTIKRFLDEWQTHCEK